MFASEAWCSKKDKQVLRKRHTMKLNIDDTDLIRSQMELRSFDTRRPTTLPKNQFQFSWKIALPRVMNINTMFWAFQTWVFFSPLLCRFNGSARFVQQSIYSTSWKSIRINYNVNDTFSICLISKMSKYEYAQFNCSIRQWQPSIWPFFIPNGAHTNYTWVKIYFMPIELSDIKLIQWFRAEFMHVLIFF